MVAKAAPQTVKINASDAVATIKVVCGLGIVAKKVVSLKNFLVNSSTIAAKGESPPIGL